MILKNKFKCKKNENRINIKNNAHNKTRCNNKLMTFAINNYSKTLH